MGQRKGCKRVAVAAACGTLIGTGLAGCACPERVTILNSTSTSVQVQFVYPWPAYAIAVGSGRHFEFMLAPGETWRSEAAPRHEATTPAIAQPNGVALVRIRREVVWQLYGLMNDAPLESIAPIELTIVDNDARLGIAARDRQGQDIPVEELDDYFWFRPR